MHPNFFTRRMYVHVSGTTACRKRSDKVTSIDAEYINLWYTTCNRCPNVFVPVTNDIREITSYTARTIIGCNILTYVFGCDGLNLLGTIGSIDGYTIRTEHPHVRLATSIGTFRVDFNISLSYQQDNELIRVQEINRRRRRRRRDSLDMDAMIRIQLRGGGANTVVRRYKTHSFLTGRSNRK